MAVSKQFRKRNAILSYLQNTKAHPSAEMVYFGLKEECPDLSLGTVYRNLTLFKEQGLAVSVGTVSGVERFDGNTEPHVHFICTDCGSVSDLAGMETPQTLCHAEEKDCGGRVDVCHLSFAGICKTCMEKN